MMLPLLKTFLELLLWNRFQYHRHILFFGCLQYSEMFIPLTQTLFSETDVIHSQIRGIESVFHFSYRFLGQQTASQRAPCKLEHCHGGESSRWAKVQAFFSAQLHVIASAYLHNKIG
jgi:hypothetical protein